MIKKRNETNCTINFSHATNIFAPPPILETKHSTFPKFEKTCVCQVVVLNRYRNFQLASKDRWQTNDHAVTSHNFPKLAKGKVSIQCIEKNLHHLFSIQFTSDISHNFPKLNTPGLKTTPDPVHYIILNLQRCHTLFQLALKYQLLNLVGSCVSQVT